jgi:hypothetical protein
MMMMMMKFITPGASGPEGSITNILHKQFCSRFHKRLQAPTILTAKPGDSYNPNDLSLSNAVVLVVVLLKGYSLSV